MPTLRLPFSSARESAAIRRQVRDLLSGLSPELLEDALLVITELVDNVVQHAGGPGELCVRCEDDTVWIEVHDLSRTFPQLQRKDPYRLGGRGLLLIAAIAQTWGSRPTPSGKVVWACLGARRPAGQRVHQPEIHGSIDPGPGGTPD